MTKCLAVVALAVMSVCSTCYARVHSDPSPAGTGDALASAQAAELKGDRARIDKNYLQAVTEYQRALRFDPKNSALCNKLGIVEFKLDNKGAARKYFTLAVKFDPNEPSALNNLGALALVQRNFKQAASYLKRALALDESSASAHLNLAEAWVGLSQIDRAMTEYSRALELNPDILQENENGVVALVRTQEQRARMEYLLAKAYAKRGNADGALDYLQRAKTDLFPDLHKVYAEQEFALLWTDPRLAKIVKR